MSGRDRASCCPRPAHPAPPAPPGQAPLAPAPPASRARGAPSPVLPSGVTAACAASRALASPRTRVALARPVTPPAVGRRRSMAMCSTLQVAPSRRSRTVTWASRIRTRRHRSRCSLPEAAVLCAPLISRSARALLGPPPNPIAPSAPRVSFSRAPSTASPVGAMCPTSSGETATASSALGTLAIGAPAASVAVTAASRRSSGAPTPRENPSQASAARPIARCTGCLPAFAAASSRCASQGSAIGPCDSRHASAPAPIATSTTSASSSRASTCSRLSRAPPTRPAIFTTA